ERGSIREGALRSVHVATRLGRARRRSHGARRFVVLRCRRRSGRAPVVRSTRDARDRGSPRRRGRALASPQRPRTGEMMRIFAGAVAAVLVVLASTTALADDTIKRPGDHPPYSV